MNEWTSRLVVVPSDPISAYENAGYGDWLKDYYNPCHFFDEVYALSPLEKGERTAHGMTIIGVDESDFTDWLRRLQPHVVRGYGGYWASDLVCSRRLSNIPVVVSVHDTNPANIHKSVCYADLLICMTHAVADQVRARGAHPKRIRVMPNRVDRSIFFPRKDEQFISEFNQRFPQKKRILHVGRKSKQKNLETVIGALAQLPDDYCAIFIGRGNADPYRQIASEFKVSDRCYWIESVKSSDLPHWYSACDCMCTPSLWEGFGIVFIEAAACGAPIITSDIAPMNEYLSNNISASLVTNFQDPIELSRVIRKVCEDSFYRTAISVGAQEIAVRFDKGKIDEQESQIYGEVIDNMRQTLSRRFSINIWRGQYFVRAGFGEILSTPVALLKGKQ